MISSTQTQRSQSNSLRNSIDYKERHDPKSRRSSFVQNLILEYKTQSSKKSSNIKQQSTRYNQENSLGQKIDCSMSKKVVNKLLLAKENDGTIPTKGQMSVQRKLFSNIINNNNNNVLFPSSNEDIGFLQKYKSTQIRADTYCHRNIYNNNHNNTTKGNSNNKMPRKDNEMKLKNMSIINKNNKQYDFQSQYSSQVLRNIMFNSNTNTTSRERFIKKGMIINVDNNNNNNNNKNNNTNKNINNNSKRANIQKSTQRQKIRNIIDINTNANQQYRRYYQQKLTQFTKQFNKQFNDCVKLLLLQQYKQQEGLDLLLVMKKGSKQFVEQYCGNTNRYTSDYQSKIMLQIQMMEFLCLALYQMFVRKCNQVKEQQQLIKKKQKSQQLQKLQEKLQSKYAQLTNKLSRNSNQSSIITLNKCYSIIKLNRLNSLLMRIKLKRNEQNSPTGNNNVDQINLLIKEIKKLLLLQQQTKNNDTNKVNVNHSKPSHHHQLLSIVLQTIIITTTNYHRQQELSQLTIITQKLLQFNRQLILFNNSKQKFAYCFDNNQCSKQLNNQLISVTNDNNIGLQMLLIKIISQSQTIIFEQVKKSMLLLQSDSLGLFLNQINSKLNLIQLRHAIKQTLNQQQSFINSNQIKINQQQTKNFTYQKYITQQQSKSQIHIQKLIIIKITIFIFSKNHQENQNKVTKTTIINKQQLLIKLENELKRSFDNHIHFKRKQQVGLFNNIEQQRQYKESSIKCSNQNEYVEFITTVAIMFPKVFVIWYQILQTICYKQQFKCFQSHKDKRQQINHKYSLFHQVDILQQMRNFTLSKLNKLKNQQQSQSQSQLEQQQEHLQQEQQCPLYFHQIIIKKDNNNLALKLKLQNKLTSLIQWLQRRLFVIYYQIGQLGRCCNYLSKMLMENDDDINNLYAHNNNTDSLSSLQSWCNLRTADNKNNKNVIYQLYISWKVCSYIKNGINCYQQQQYENQQYKQVLNQNNTQQISLILMYQLIQQLSCYSSQININSKNIENNIKLSLQKVFDDLFSEYFYNDDQYEQQQEQINNNNDVGIDKQQYQQRQFTKQQQTLTTSTKVLLLLVYFQLQLIKAKNNSQISNNLNINLTNNPSINNKNNNHNSNSINNNINSSSITMQTFQNDEQNDNHQFQLYNHLNNQQSSSQNYYQNQNYLLPISNGKSNRQNRQYNNLLSIDDKEHNKVNYQKIIIMINKNLKKYNKPIQYHQKSIKTNLNKLQHLFKLIQKGLYQLDLINSYYHQLKNMFNDLKYDYQVLINSNIQL